MKELEVFFEKVDKVLNNTMCLDSRKSYLPFRWKFVQKHCQCAIEAQKQILRIIVKYRLLEKDENIDKKKNREQEEAEIAQLNQSLSDETKIIIRLSLRYSIITSFISDEALYENKFISPINDNIIDEGIEAIRNKLLDLDIERRRVYTNIFCATLDSLLFSTFDKIRMLEHLGWEKFFLVKKISDYLTLIFELFALFDIDLFSTIKKYSDYEKEFSLYFRPYEYFRPEKFKNESLFPKEVKSYNKDSKECESLLDYINMDDKDKYEWLLKAKSKTNYQELANFLGEEIANGNLKSPPSKKGGGLFNLACLVFPVLDSNNNTQKNAINNAVKKYKGYKEAQKCKPQKF